MSNCLKQDGEFSVLIAKIVRCFKSDYVVYDLEVSGSTQNVVWTLSRRYSEFFNLHNNLCKFDSSVKNIQFPPKNPFNNFNSNFISKRRNHLEIYFNLILQKFPIPPPPLSQFLDWNLYEIHGITNSLAKRLFENGELIISKGFQFEFTALQIYAINQRLQSQSPTNLYNEVCTDFVHVMEFIGRIRNVKVVGSTSYFNSSNIIINKLEFDMSKFGSLEKLELDTVDLRQMSGFDRLKEMIRHLKVCHSMDNIKSLSLGDLLSLGNGDWVFGKDPVPTNCWSKVEVLDLSKNYLHGLDPSMTLFNKVRILKLNNNFLTEVRNLDILENLRTLNLSQNKLGTTFHTSENLSGPTLRGLLGNVTELDLSGNQLRSAKLIDCLYSLIKLNLGNNEIDELGELRSLSSLPCIESVILLGNPVCSKPGYRRVTLQLFGDRFNLVKLDLRLPDDAEFVHLNSVLFGASMETEKSHQKLSLQNDQNSFEQSSLGNENREVDCHNLEVSIESEVNRIVIF